MNSIGISVLDSPASQMPMYTVKLTVITISAAMQFGLAFGQTDIDRNAIEIPLDLLSTLRSRPGIRDCLQQHFPLEKIVSTSRFDLNRPKQRIVLVEGLLPCLSGNVNHDILLYVHTGEGWRKVLDGFGGKLERVSSGTRGWQDLVMWQHGSRTESVRLVYQYDGNEYKATSCKDVKFADTATDEPFSPPKYSPCNWDWKRSKN